MGFVYFLSVEDKDPLSVVELLRTTESLPKQYRTGVYDNSKAAIKQFVFVLNDSPDATRFNAVKAVLASQSQFPEVVIHEIRMSASASTPPPAQDLWTQYMDLDLRAFDKTANRIRVPGQAFSTNDRTQAQVIVHRVIEKSLLPFAVQRIQAIEQNIAKTRKGISKFLRVFKTSERGENDGAQSNFHMNRSELELRTLIDLAFVI